MYKKNLKFLVMSKDMAKSLVAAALMVAFSTPVAANTATGSRSASGAFSKQADGIVMPTDADGSNGSNASGGLVGLEFLKGKTEDEIKNAVLTPGSELNDNKPDEVFFLYNVKTGKFLNAGGYWGTHVSLKDYPLSLWANVTQITDENADNYGAYIFNDRKIISGRDNLIGCYFFDQGNLYYSSKDRVRGLRGFSCWFKPVDSSTPTNTKLNLYIDGVANGTTGIDEVAFGDEEPTGKAAKGIYNMNGQLVSNGSDTTNLPAGMYIVNGKKCVVR